MDTTVIEMVNWNGFWALQGLFVTMGVLGGGLWLFIEQSFAMVWAHAQAEDFSAQMEIEEAMEAVNNLFTPRFEVEEPLNIEVVCDPLDSPEPMGAVLMDTDMVFIGMEMVTAIPEATQILLAEESEELEEEEADNELWERLLPRLEERQNIFGYMRAA